MTREEKIERLTKARCYLRQKEQKLEAAEFVLMRTAKDSLDYTDAFRARNVATTELEAADYVYALEQVTLIEGGVRE